MPCCPSSSPSLSVWRCSPGPGNPRRRRRAHRPRRRPSDIPGDQPAHCVDHDLGSGKYHHVFNDHIHDRVVDHELGSGNYHHVFNDHIHDRDGKHDEQYRDPSDLVVDHNFDIVHDDDNGASRVCPSPRTTRPKPSWGCRSISTSSTTTTSGIRQEPSVGSAPLPGSSAQDSGLTRNTGRIVGTPDYAPGSQCEFEYTLVNSEGTSRTARAVIIVAPSGVPPRTPQAADDFGTTVVGQVITLNVFDNDDLGEPSALCSSIFFPGGGLSYSGRCLASLEPLVEFEEGTVYWEIVIDNLIS